MPETSRAQMRVRIDRVGNSHGARASVSRKRPTNKFGRPFHHEELIRACECATAGHAATAAPIRPYRRPWATLAASVAAMPRPRSHRASAGTASCGALSRAHHRTRVDQPVHRERRNHVGYPACLTTRSHEIVGVFI